jgi:hypothetical protein
MNVLITSIVESAAFQKLRTERGVAIGSVQ